MCLSDKSSNSKQYTDTVGNQGAEVDILPNYNRQLSNLINSTYNLIETHTLPYKF